MELSLHSNWIKINNINFNSNKRLEWRDNRECTWYLSRKVPTIRREVVLFMVIRWPRIPQTWTFFRATRASRILAWSSQMGAVCQVGKFWIGTKRWLAVKLMSVLRIRRVAKWFRPKASSAKCHLVYSTQMETLHPPSKRARVWKVTGSARVVIEEWWSWRNKTSALITLKVQILTKSRALENEDRIRPWIISKRSEGGEEVRSR